MIDLRKQYWKDFNKWAEKNWPDLDDMIFNYLVKEEEKVEPKTRMPYGKFKGKEMHEIPSGYLKWLAENFGEFVAVAADKEYQWREKNRQHWEED